MHIVISTKHRIQFNKPFTTSTVEESDNSFGDGDLVCWRAVDAGRTGKVIPGIACNGPAKPAGFIWWATTAGLLGVASDGLDEIWTAAAAPDTANVDICRGKGKNVGTVPGVLCIITGGIEE